MILCEVAEAMTNSDGQPTFSSVSTYIKFALVFALFSWFQNYYFSLKDLAVIGRYRVPQCPICYFIVVKDSCINL